MIPNMVRIAWIGLVAAMLAFGPACQKKKKRAPPAEDPAEAAPAKPHTGNRLQRPKPLLPSPQKLRQRRRLEPIAVDEMTAAIPTPAGAVVLTAPAKPKVGERVQATYCFENTEVKAAAEKVKATLEAKGWNPVHLRFREDQPHRAAVASQKPPYRVSASVQRSQAPKCSGTDGHAYVTVTMHKLTQTRTAPRPGAP